jgi:hypothetical protein
VAIGGWARRWWTVSAGAFLLSVAAFGGVAGTGGAAGAAPRPAVLGISPTALDLGAPPLGTYNGPVTFTVTNGGTVTDTIDLDSSDLTFTGVGADDSYVFPASGCPGNGTTTVVLAPSASCTLDVEFFPGALGPRDATITLTGSADTTGTTEQVDGSGAIG